MDDFMQWAMNSLDQQQPHAPAAAPPSYGGDTGGAGPVAFPFPSLQALRCQSTSAGRGGIRDLTVQVDQHLAASRWSASSTDSPGAGAAAMDHDATAAAAGWSPHTARARTSRPVSWNFSASASAQTTTDASLASSPAAATAASERGGPSTPAARRRAGWLLAAPTATASHGQGGGGTTAASSSASAGGPVQDHIIAERRRREKINQRFIELSTVIPGLKKMDKATILGDAVKYVREMQEKVKKLEDGEGAATTSTIRSAVMVNKKKPCLGLAGAGDGDGEPSHGGGGADGELPEIEVRLSDEKSVLLRIHCVNTRGVLVRVLAEVEELRLAITHTSVMPFPAATAIITITAKTGI
ncbi:unnamed protein product [Alopecurus aequalis]